MLYVSITRSKFIFALDRYEAILHGLMTCVNSKISFLRQTQYNGLSKLQASI